jgi:hypothetical protein
MGGGAGGAGEGGEGGERGECGSQGQMRWMLLDPVAAQSMVLPAELAEQ